MVRLVNFATTAAFVTGLAAIARGAWLIYEPAGFIVGGVALVAVSTLYARGGET